MKTQLNIIFLVILSGILLFGDAFAEGKKSSKKSKSIAAAQKGTNDSDSVSPAPLADDTPIDPSKIDSSKSSDSSRSIGTPKAKKKKKRQR